MDSNKIYKKDLYLETENLILRPFKKEDRKDLVKNYNDSKVYSKNIPNFPYPYTLKDADTFIKKKKYSYKKKDVGIELAVFLKKENRVIGGVTLSHIDFKNKKCESGSYITKKYWGTGYIYEAKLELYKFAFKYLNLVRIYSNVFSYNPRSKKHLEKLGFIQEGYVRKDYFYKGKHHDMFSMGLLKEDFKYKELKKKLLK